MPELRDLFITYLAREQFDLDNEKLAAWALDMEENGDGRTVSNQGGYQSNDIMDPPEVLEPLYNELTNFGNDLCQRINIAPIVIDNMWVNVNRYRDFNWLYSHNQATVSGVYYVKTPPDCVIFSFQILPQILKIRGQLLETIILILLMVGGCHMKKEQYIFSLHM